MDNFIANKNNVRIFKKCITIANSGSVGASFYQPYKFVASDHVTALKIKNTSEKAENLFITTLLKKLEETYSFNREINNKRLKIQKILLPIDKKEEVNFEYMKEYMQALEMKKQLQVLEHMSKKIS